MKGNRVQFEVPHFKADALYLFDKIQKKNSGLKKT